MYVPEETRYSAMPYRRCGRCGLWHNFGGVGTPENARTMVRRAFDLTSALIGASRVAQSDDAAGALAAPVLSDAKIQEIDAILA